MKRLFDPDTPLMRLLSQLAELAILNVLWVVCCVPLVTAGAATTGLYRAVLGMVREKGGAPWRLFLREFRGSFRRSTALWLILLGALALIGADLGLCYFWDFPGEILLLGLAPVVLLLWLGTAAYAFPLTAQFDNTVKGTLKNAVVLAVSHPLRSLAILFLDLLPLLMLLVSADTFWRFFMFWLLLGFGVTAYVNSLLFVRIFQPYIPE